MLKIFRQFSLRKHVRLTPLRCSSRFQNGPSCLRRSNKCKTEAQIKTSRTIQGQNGAIVKPQNTTLPLDLASGQPPPEVLEASGRLLTRASEKLLKASRSIEMLDYGPNPGPQSCRNQLSQFLSHRYRSGVEADWLFIMAGASQALHLLPSILGSARGSCVFIEQPTYMHAIDVLSKDYMYNVMPIETDRFGICPEAFRKAIGKSLTPKAVSDSKASNRYASILYVQTAFANPGGWSLPRERMIELEKIAKQFNILILADDVYSFTNFSELTGEKSPKTVLPYLPSTCTNNGALSDHIVTIGSFSKLIGPGLRFGWIVASGRVLEAVNQSGFILSGGCPNQYVASLVGELIADGSADILTDMVRKELKSRFEIGQGIFATHLPGVIHYTMPQGGFFTWITIPKSLTRYYQNDTSTTLVSSLRDRYGVRVVDGTRCLLPSLPVDYWAIRVSMTVLQKSELSGALRMLSDGICDYFGFKQYP